MLKQNQEFKNHFETMARKWAAPFVAREKINLFTGGAISPGRMANLDCLGEGPRGRIRIGRKVCYPIKPLIDWLIERSVALD